MEDKQGSVRLGLRLQAIGNAVLPGLTLADIGSDHALLPMYLLGKHIISSAIITELDDGPYKKAEKTIASSCWRQYIQLRKGDGLQPLKPGEASSVVIAGLGGDTIAEILSRDWHKAESFQHYILQPMSRAFVLRRVLARRGWSIGEETLVREKRKIYVVIIAQPGNSPYSLSPLAADLGPGILNGHSPLKDLYLQSWRNKYLRIIEGLVKSGRSHDESIMEEYRQKIKALEAMTDGE